MLPSPPFRQAAACASRIGQHPSQRCLGVSSHPCGTPFLCTWIGCSCKSMANSCLLSIAIGELIFASIKRVPLLMQRVWLQSRPREQRHQSDSLALCPVQASTRLHAALAGNPQKALEGSDVEISSSDDDDSAAAQVKTLHSAWSGCPALLISPSGDQKEHHQCGTL